MLLTQLRPVQTFLVQEALKLVSSATDHSISIDRVKVSWLDQAELKEILIRDLQNDTLIYSGSLMINYSIRDILNGDYLSIEEIGATDLRLKLTKYDSTSKLNISELLDALKKDTSANKESTPMYISQLTLSNLHLSLNDKTREVDKTRLDFSNLDFSIPYFTLGELAVESDTIFGDIIQMKGVENNTNFAVDELSTRFYFSDQSLSIDNLSFRTPTSQISDSLEFFYNGLDDLGNFVDSVSFICHFDNSRISKEDVKILSGKDLLQEDITIDGVVWGSVGDFNIEETRFGYGNSYFTGGVSCFGLPDLSQTFVLADLTDSHVLPSDLRHYIGDYADNLNQMGRIDFTGSFVGFLKDFVARGDFVTDQGSIHTDINIKIPENPDNMSYDGNLEFKNVNVGTFFQNKIAQEVNLIANINGRGINRENAEFDLDAVVYQSGLKGYVYDSVKMDGSFAKNYFEGDFEVKDPNCDLAGVARIDFRQVHEILDLEIEVNKLNANTINLTSQHISAKGKLAAEVIDFDIDDFTGILSVDSVLFNFDDSTIEMDSLRMTAQYKDSTRIIQLAFPGLEAELKGEFKISDAILDIPAMASSYAQYLHFISDSSHSKVSGANYKLSFNAKINDVSRYLDSLDIPYAFGGKTEIESTYRQSKNANVSIFIQSDTFLMGDSKFIHPTLEINGSHDLADSNTLTNFILESPKQDFEGMPNTENLLLEGVWYDRNIDLTTHISQPFTASDIRIESNVKLQRDSIILKMLPSDIKLLDDRWTFNPTNKIVFTGNRTSISNLEIYDSSESIAIEGEFADSTRSEILISSEDLNMDKASLFSEAAIGGFLNGNFKMFRENSGVPFKFNGAFLFKNLAYDDLNVGDVSGSSEWNPDNKSIYTKVEVERENVNAMQLDGYYYPSKVTDQLDFNVTFEEADLKMGEPFLKENFSDIEGEASGSLKLTGTIQEPKLVGDFRILNGGVTVNYLGTHYSYNGAAKLHPGSIELSNFHLVDRKGSDARVTGTIQHNSFKYLATDIKINAINFEFLNTTSLDNSLYYGSAYGTGEIFVTGPLNDLNIKADIKTEADTRFLVPVSEGTSVAREDYISFVNFLDTTRVVEEDFKISGLTLEFDIDVTPDAYCELIFDIKTGDIIRGRGRGSLKLRLDTDGEFSIFGPLEITEGAYNFTVPNLLNKEFDVVPGSRITWYGDPYNATLDLDATYLQRASFEELENPSEQNQSELSRKVPILVILRIDGGMLSPQIDFDLELQNESDANQDNIPLLSQIKSDEQELKRQVISLLFLKRFSHQQSFTLSGGGSVRNSVSEFLSSQVSYLISQFDENLEVEVNLADLNSEAFNTFQLRFAYTFLNGRLKVTRGGTFGNQNDENSNLLNDLVGDWSVEYSLTKDGRLRAKVFSITDQRIQVNENQQNQELGISLRFVHSFNDLTELLAMKRDEVLARRREEEVEEEEKKKEEENEDSAQ